MKKTAVLFSILFSLILIAGQGIVFAQTFFPNLSYPFATPTYIQVEYEVTCLGPDKRVQPMPYAKLTLDYRKQNLRTAESDKDGRGIILYELPSSTEPRILGITAEDYSFGIFAQAAVPNYRLVTIPGNADNYYTQVHFYYQACPPDPQPTTSIKPVDLDLTYDVQCGNPLDGPEYPLLFRGAKVNLYRGADIVGSSSSGGSNSLGNIFYPESSPRLGTVYTIMPEPIPGLLLPSAHQFVLRDFQTLRDHFSLIYPECPASITPSGLSPEIQEKGVVNITVDFDLTCGENYEKVQNSSVDLYAEGKYLDTVTTNDTGHGTISFAANPLLVGNFQLIPGYSTVAAQQPPVYEFSINTPYEPEYHFVPDLALYAYECPLNPNTASFQITKTIQDINNDEDVPDSIIEQLPFNTSLQSPLLDAGGDSNNSACESKDWTDRETGGEPYCNGDQLCYRKYHSGPDTNCQDIEVETDDCDYNDYCASLLPAEAGSQPEEPTE